MARSERSRRGLSFSEGHALSAAFVAAGYPSVPTSRDLRELIEIGLAAKNAGFAAARQRDGRVLLLQPFASAIVDQSRATQQTSAPSDCPSASHVGNAESTSVEAGPEFHQQNTPLNSENSYTDISEARETPTSLPVSDDTVNPGATANDNIAETDADQAIDVETQRILASALDF